VLKKGVTALTAKRALRHVRSKKHFLVNCREKKKKDAADEEKKTLRAGISASCARRDDVRTGGKKGVRRAGRKKGPSPL